MGTGTILLNSVLKHPSTYMDLARKFRDFTENYSVHIYELAYQQGMGKGNSVSGALAVFLVGTFGSYCPQAEEGLGNSGRPICNTK